MQDFITFLKPPVHVIRFLPFLTPMGGQKLAISLGKI